MSRLGSSILSTAVFTGLGAFTYSAWRTHEISKIRVKAEELAANGFIYVDMAKVVTPEEKKEAFDKHLKPHLLKHWEKVEPTLDLDRGEWPMPERGRPLHLTSTKTDVPGMPKIFTGNYTPQAVIAYLFCPRLSVVHFGPQTAFKLKLLLKPLWAAAHAVQAIPGVGPLDKLEEMCRPQHMFQLEAADQAWHIIALPNRKYGTVGHPVPHAAHFDAGEGGVFKQGMPVGWPHDQAKCSTRSAQKQKVPSGAVGAGEEQPAAIFGGTYIAADALPHSHGDLLYPPPADSMAREKALEQKAFEQRMLSMALHQVGILFYSETPGELNETTGMTGFWPRSHLVMMDAIAKLLPILKRQKVAEKSDSNLIDTDTTGDADADDESGDVAVDWWTHTATVKHMFQNMVDHPSSGEGTGIAKNRHIFVQPKLREDQAILALGPLVHTSMWVRELMPNNNPRSIQNIKITGTKELRRGRPTDGSDMSTNPKDWKSVDYSAQKLLLESIPRDSLLFELFVRPVDVLRSSSACAEAAAAATAAENASAAAIAAGAIAGAAGAGAAGAEIGAEAAVTAATAAATAAVAAAVTAGRPSQAQLPLQSVLQKALRGNYLNEDEVKHLSAYYVKMYLHLQNGQQEKAKQKESV